MWREGVLRGLVFIPGTGFTGRVTTGAGVIQGDDQPNQGKYLVDLIVADAQLVFDPPPATGSRTDLVVLRVTDPNAGGGTPAQGTCSVIRGTAGTPGAVPALPSTAIEIARVTLNAGDLSILPARVTTPGRSVALVANGAGMGILSTALGTTAVDGDTRYVTDNVIPGGYSVANNGRPASPGLYTFDAPRWTPPWNMPWGIMGMQQRMTDAGPVPVGSEATVAGLSVQFFSVANRRLKVTFEGNCYANGVTDSISFVRIVDGPTALMVTNSWNNTPGYATGIHAEAFHSPAAGFRDYYIRLGQVGGLSNAFLVGRGDAPMSLVVEDIGPNGSPV
jgi:hypothetical protein